MSNSATLTKTPLNPLLIKHGARMVEYSGFEMPVQFEGILTEHLHTRAAAGLFEVSHMGQAMLTGPDYASVAKALEQITPGDFQNLAPGQQKYSMLLNAQGGIIDDMMVFHPEDYDCLRLIVNASRKVVDYATIREALPEGVELKTLDDLALIALQGPKAIEAVAAGNPEAQQMKFMNAKCLPLFGIDTMITRSGYTGEDGFEISVAADQACDLASKLLEFPFVKPIGLGARDALRLEAGLPLYGNDIDETTSPAEAGLMFAVSPARRERADFPGAERILSELANRPERKLVGLSVEGRLPARHGADVLLDGQVVGVVTSGAFAPSLEKPIALAYVQTDLAKEGQALSIQVRNKTLSSTVVKLPFVKHNYQR